MFEYPWRPARPAPMAVVTVVLLGTAACGGDDDDDASAGGSGGGATAVTIALLLPETKTARYETQDRPLFEAKVEELCPDCEILYSNADQDAAEQQSQAEAALTNGADVLVLDPVDGASAGVDRGPGQGAGRAGHQLRPADHDDADIDFYICFDNEKVGELQATALDRQAGRGRRHQRRPRDDQRLAHRQQRHPVQGGRALVLDESDFTIGAEYDTPDWSPDEAQQEMEQAITQLGADGFVGVYAANDGTAGGAIAAMKAAGVDPLPPGHRPGRRAGRHPAHPRRRAVHDGLQGHQARGRDRRRGGRRPRPRRGPARGRRSTSRSTTARARSRRRSSTRWRSPPTTSTTRSSPTGSGSVEEICEGDYAAACEAAGIA